MLLQCLCKYFILLYTVSCNGRQIDLRKTDFRKLDASEEFENKKILFYYCDYVF